MELLISDGPHEIKLFDIILIAMIDFVYHFSDLNLTVLTKVHLSFFYLLILDLHHSILHF